MTHANRWSLGRLAPVAALAAATAVGACSDEASAPLEPAPAPALSVASTVTTAYDVADLAEYGTRWLNIYGPLSLDANGTLDVAPGGAVTVSAVPFQVGADFSVFDHLKYIAISADQFEVPEDGSLTFSVDIDASTPGASFERVIRGCYGEPFSFQSVDDPCDRPWTGTALQGMQAGVVLNMINFQTGQLFDWFVSDNQVFALIERLPSNVTNPALEPGDPGYVGLDDAYTQIIRVQNVGKGRTHNLAIRYTRGPQRTSTVEYLLNGRLFASVDDVGIPLDVQGVEYTGYHPSLGDGERVKDDLNAFVIGHGLFSLLDAFPYQHPERPDLSVSIPMSERLFGQGATGTFSNFRVVQVTNEGGHGKP